MDVLTERQQALLDFAGRWYRYAGAQEQAILDEFGLSATRFRQQINDLIDRQAALAYAPTTVKRLRRLRAAKLQARNARRIFGYSAGYSDQVAKSGS